ncbi:nucleotide-binding protein [Brevibacillus ruminantium]|uniref:Nucleotide-binding protein n=1 Tax=Brevibacillus ruminantium TaxID=2950604 RepID=A0ABY4WFE3_9BACL|nr:TIR domain-containing protein [Brevibacillus ruminantium]USG65748.1 nucleotide-binding protein [Brevibacillus ruminantium]
MTGNRTVYISYSWTNEEHKKNVWIFAEMLVRDGIQVKIDIWDLKKGHDVHVFMQSMVTSNEIHKVLIICDKGYKEKAESRKGGVGAETNIITSQIYDIAKQEKFIPVVVEKDTDGQPYIPTYLSTRLYIDLSSSSSFEEQYQSLVRDIYGVPLHKKPLLGQPPQYLLAEVGVALTAQHEDRDSAKEEEKVRYWYQQLVKKDEDHSEYIAPFFEYFRDAIHPSPTTVALLSSTIQLDMEIRIYRMLEQATDKMLFLDVLKRYGLEGLFIERVIDYCQFVNIKSFENHRYSELLMRLCEYFNHLHGHEINYIKALYRHVSRADERFQQRGNDDNGLDTISLYIGLLYPDLIVPLLEKYGERLTGWFPTITNWGGNLEINQILSIVNGCSLSESEKEKLRFRYLVGLHFRAKLTSNIYLILKKQLEGEYHQRPIEKMNVYDSTVEFKFSHKEYSERDVYYSIKVEEDIVSYCVRIGLGELELAITQHNVAEDGIVDMHFRYGDKKGRIKESDYNNFDQSVAERLREYINLFLSASFSVEATSMSIAKEKPSVFIGSSGKNVKFAKAIHFNLEDETYPTPWTAHDFQLSSSILDGLIDALEKSDFAVFVFAPDDAATAKDQQVTMVRDNVLFELGLSMGKLGRERTFFVAPRELGDLHIPTDLLGVTYAPYDASRPDGNYEAALLTACEKIKREIARVGSRAR